MPHCSSPSRVVLDAREEAEQGTVAPEAELTRAVSLLLAPAFSPSLGICDHNGAGMLTEGRSKSLSQRVCPGETPFLINPDLTLNSIKGGDVFSQESGPALSDFRI